MGVQSTVTIDRDRAIERILKIRELILQRRYRDLEKEAFEPDLHPKELVDNWDADDSCFVDNLQNWTNGMLGDQLDYPFFRFSMFENYDVVN
jgi:hypothetical protein